MTIFKQYYVYIFSLPLNNLQNTVQKLKDSRDVRTKQYFKGDELQERQLRHRFSNLTIEDSLIRGRAEFETAENSVDLDGNFDVIIKTHKLDFFIGFNPKHHLIVVSNGRGIARLFSRIVSRIFFNGDSTRLILLKLNDNQILNFLNSNKCIMKGVYRSTTMEGISTMGLLGPNIEKPMEMEIINKYLSDHRAIKPLLLDYDWTIWISKKTGVLCCLDPHNTIDFLEFIQKKILSLAI